MKIKNDPFGFQKAIKIDKLDDPKILKELEKIFLKDETKEKEKSILECRAKLCSNILRPDYQSRKDPRYCLDCMPF